MPSRTANTPQNVHVALLRGVNVGGKSLLPMAELSAMFSALRCADVRTYIQSGNVVFRANAALARRIPKLIHDAIADQFGYDVPVLTRTAAELAAVPRTNPFLKPAVDPKLLHVAFLGNAPSTARITALDPKRSAPDEFVVRGREIYLKLPNGVARSKLTNDYFESKLGTSSSLRNWRTVLTLIEMASAPGDA